MGRAGTLLTSYSLGGRIVVTWLRRGQTCVLSGRGGRLMPVSVPIVYVPLDAFADAQFGVYFDNLKVTPNQ